MQIITVKSATTASFRAINLCPVSTVEYLIMYSKNKSVYKEPMKYVEVQYSEDYGDYIENMDDEMASWKLKSLDQIIYESN